VTLVDRIIEEAAEAGHQHVLNDYSNQDIAELVSEIVKFGFNHEGLYGKLAAIAYRMADTAGDSVEDAIKHTKKSLWYVDAIRYEGEMI